MFERARGDDEREWASKVWIWDALQRGIPCVGQFAAVVG
jgi:hypothetical protein